MARRTTETRDDHSPNLNALLLDPLTHLRIKSRTPATRRKAITAIRELTGAMEAGDVLVQLSDVLRRGRQPGFGGSIEATIAVLPTVMNTPTASGKRISGEEWLDFYTDALRTVPAADVVKSTPVFIDIGRVLAPSMLRGEDGQVDEGRVERFKSEWLNMLNLIPKKNLTTELRDTVMKGMTTIKESAQAGLPGKDGQDPKEPPIADPPVAPVVLLRPERQTPHTGITQPEEPPSPVVLPMLRGVETPTALPTRETIFERDHGQQDTPQELDVDQDRSVKATGTPISTLESRILYVLGTATRPLRESKFYRGITGKTKLPTSARKEIDSALSRLERQLQRLSPRTRNGSGTDDRYISGPTPDDPTYNLQHITVSPFPDKSLFRPEGYVDIPSKK